MKFTTKSSPKYMLKHVRRVFESLYGKDFTSETILEILQEYEALIPQKP